MPGSIENAGVTMVNNRSPAALQFTGDKSVNKNASQVIPDPDKCCGGNKAW